MKLILAQLDDFPPINMDGVIGGDSNSLSLSSVELLNSYALILFVAFAVTLFVTPFIRRLAVHAGVIDHPNDPRKIHAQPVAYLGGLAVFLGLIAAIIVSYIYNDPLAQQMSRVPLAVVIGMMAITFTGLADDVWGWDPRWKIAGQLVAAAALAIEDVGVHVADGLLTPLLGAPGETLLHIGDLVVTNGSLYYWVGTGIIAVFVLGGCNAANFIDGLDGLLSGVVAIMAIGFLCISVFMAIRFAGRESTPIDMTLSGPRIVLCMALLGAALGFLPHNFKPASIFLGDCGSLLLGYISIVVILMFGEAGHTHLVFAGLIIFALPIMDTILAIIRRIMAGTPLSTADNHHIHHQLNRALGGVRKAVIALYFIAFIFTALGVALAAFVMFTDLRIRAVYAIAFVIFSSIGVVAVKEARRQQYQIIQRKAAARAVGAASEPRQTATTENPDGTPVPTTNPANSGPTTIV